MKKILVLSSAALMATSAVAAGPTIYGKINKELRYVDQDAETKNSITGVRDVVNSPSRLGAKGDMELANNLKGSYVIELGLYSNYKKATDAGKIDLRLVNGTVSGFWGSLTAGKQYTADAAAYLGLDVMNGTGLMGSGFDMGDITGFESGADTKGFGYNYISRHEGLTYMSPEMYGLKVGVTTIDDTNNLGETNKWNVAYLGYNKMLGENKLQAHFSYGKEQITPLDDGDDKDTYWQTAVGFNMPKLMISAMYGVYSFSDKLDVTKMYLGAKYTMGPCAVAVSYINENADNDGKENKQSQLGAAFIHNFNSNLSARLTAAMVKVEEQEFDYDGGTNLADANDATVIGTGITVNF